MSYRPSVTAKKGTKEGAYALGAGTLVTVAVEVARSQGYLPWEPEHDAKVIAALFAAAVAGLKALRNWIKERRKRRRIEQQKRDLDGFQG